MKSILKIAIKKIIFLLIALAGFTSVACAQDKDSKGTDFWLTFPGNYDNGATATLFISGDNNTTGTVTIPGIGFTQNFTVTVGDVTSVVLPADVFLTTSGSIVNNGIHVTAANEVTVYGLNREQYTTDAYLGLPTDILGIDYIDLSYVTSNASEGTQFGIVATADNTTVTITPSSATDGHDAGVAYNITLNQGETYFLRNLTVNTDLTGSIIHSNNPIAVFGSHQCANVPPDQVACDYLVEELPPTNEWGKNFVTVPLKTRLNGDTFRFLASEDGTDISLNGSVVSTLNRGQYFETIINGSSQITSTKPILVAQYSNGSSYDGVTSDPFMMLIPPSEQFLGDYTITTPATGFSGNYINIVAPTEAIGNIKLDGTTIPATDFSVIGSSGFSGAQEDISLGVHTINGTTQRFGVFVYGYADYDSYGYPGGQSLAPVATVTSLTLTPATGSAKVNTSSCFTALVEDQFKKPVVGVAVDFNVSGANAGTTGFANTDADGKAQFCYDGPSAGKDTITAFVGTIGDSSYFTRIKLSPPDNAPYFDYPPTPADGTTLNAHPGESVTFTVTSEDSDVNDHVTLTVTGLPTGSATVPVLPVTGNPASAQFSWTPGAGDVGTYPIQFTATDDSGKTTITNVIVQVTSVSCNPKFRPFVYVFPTVTVPRQACHTIYRGYGPQSVILIAVPRGGSGNPWRYKYKWNDGSTLPIRCVSPDVTTKYCVDITDGEGCTAHACVTIHVVDVRCGKRMDKIELCLHKHTLCIDRCFVNKLICDGAKLGGCGTEENVTAFAGADVESADALKSKEQHSFVPYPNPAVSSIRFKWDMNIKGNIKINITDLQGRTIITQTMVNTGQSINISKLSNGVYMAQLIINDRQVGVTRFNVIK